GATVTVTGTDGTTLDLRMVRGDVGQNTAYVTPEAAETLVPDAQVTTIYARMADDADAVATAGAVQNAVNEVTEADGSAPVLQVGGAAVERAAYGQRSEEHTSELQSRENL